jgi:digeranylgeranylglycerophospholipid reductase
MDYFDILVIGSGPAGATTARISAEHGLKVLLVDKRQELGAPIQCSGAISAHALHDVDVIPDPEYLSTSIYGFSVYDSNGQVTKLDYRELKPEQYHQKPLGYVVDRRRFDRYLMTQAERSGVKVWLKAEAIGYEKQSGGSEVKVRLKRFGEEVVVRARVLVGADGLQSQVGKWAGLKTHIKLSELASCLQYVVDGVETDGLLEIITGHKWAPGGYAWVFSKGENYAEVGLGVIRSFTKNDAKWHLENFLKNSFMSYRLKHAKILEVQGGGVPLTSPLKKQFADNIILVGDAARHVNPITGGGIHTALRCGKIAGDFLGEFLSTGNKPTEKCLEEYQERWMKEQGHAMWRLYQIKRNIFKQKIAVRDKMLYKTLSDYFRPESEFRKI